MCNFLLIKVTAWFLLHWFSKTVMWDHKQSPSTSMAQLLQRILCCAVIDQGDVHYGAKCCYQQGKKTIHMCQKNHCTQISIRAKIHQSRKAKAASGCQCIQLDFLVSPVATFSCHISLSVFLGTLNCSAFSFKQAATNMQNSAKLLIFKYLSPNLTSKMCTSYISWHAGWVTESSDNPEVPLMWQPCSLNLSCRCPYFPCPKQI